ncbi:hypothetical protein LJR245_007548 [Rhizobium leguminosarum]
MNDQSNGPKKRTLAEKAELVTVCLAVFWIFFTVVTSIIRWEQLTALDLIGNAVGVITGLGFWFRLKPHQVIAQLMCFVLILLLLLMSTMFLPRLMG